MSHWEIVSRFVVRAPLLPASGADPVTALRAHPLGKAAIALGSPALSEALSHARGVTPEARGALGRYARRAAFRPTPAGLWAGVGVGHLGTRSAIATGGQSAHVAPSWGWLGGFGRRLLDEPGVRPFVKLRVAPSLIVRGRVAAWLAFDGPLVWREAPLDDLLESVLAAADAWTPWPDVRAAVEDPHAPDDDVRDDYLLALVAEGLLHHDLTPPLIGPAPWPWMRARLGELPAGVVPVSLHAVQQALDALDIARARVALRDLMPGQADDAPELHGVLVMDAAKPVATLSRRALERAAALAPFLLRLQQALLPPVRERALDAGLADTLHGFCEVFGAGAFDAGSLTVGDYGARLDQGSEGVTAAPNAPVLSHLMDAVVAAARQGQSTLTLDRETLEPLLPALEPPPHLELVVTPSREPRGAAPGTDWLLGLHGPAGASWGRFAGALGQALAPAFEALVAHERAHPDGEALDVLHAASTTLADVSQHPAVRPRALALAGWPAGSAAVRPGDLEIVVDPPTPMALRDRAGGSLAPSPLHRVRSTTAPRGLAQLATGWTLLRQHAPWAFCWGPLSQLSVLPRVVCDGFVVSPASYRLPEADAVRARGGLARWRSQLNVPRHVQIGHEDELLPVDLDAPGAIDELARAAGAGARAFEIWPPVDRLPDRNGRRVEAVVAALWIPDEETAAITRARTMAIRKAGVVPPPRHQLPDAAWRTFKLFGCPEHQDDVLLDVVAPVIAAARQASPAQKRPAIDRWFFLRYVDGPGPREHLRLRVHAGSPAALDAFAHRLGAALLPGIAAGQVTHLEAAPYFPERARYGGATTLSDVESVFEAHSDLTLSLLNAQSEDAGADDGTRLVLCVRAFESLVRALGLEARLRLALATRLREAHQGAHEQPDTFEADLSALARSLKTPMAAACDPTRVDVYTPAFAAFTARVEALAATAGRARTAALLAVIDPVLHLCANRVLGGARDHEGLCYGLWQRALDGRRARGLLD